VEKIGLIFVALVSIAGVILSRMHLENFEMHFVQEDGPVEWLTVIALLIGIIVSIYRSRILSRFRPWTFLFGLYCATVLFFFGLGEEISWGQRIFGYASPEFFLTYNSQGEFNFHNLRFGDFKVNRYIFGTLLGIIIALYYLVLPFVYQRLAKVKKFADSWGVPVPRLHHIISYLVLFGLVLSIPSAKKGEILEFGGSWICLLMILYPKNREMFSRRSFER
jgi:hypothetical protein